MSRPKKIKGRYRVPTISGGEAQAGFISIPDRILRINEAVYNLRQRLSTVGIAVSPGLSGIEVTAGKETIPAPNSLSSYIDNLEHQLDDLNGLVGHIETHLVLTPQKSRAA